MIKYSFQHYQKSSIRSVIYLLFLLYLFLVINENSNGQDKLDYINQREIPLSIEIEGARILFHPYIISLDSSGHFYLTFNDSSLADIGDNNFLLIPRSNGLLRIYRHNSIDTILITEKHLSFRLPEFRIFIGNKLSGSYIKIKELINAVVHVEIENTNVTYSSIPIYKVNLRYFKSKKIKEVEISKQMDKTITDSKKSGFFTIDKTIFTELGEEIPNILSVNVIIIIDEQLVKLPPAVYFIEE